MNNDKTLPNLTLRPNITDKENAWNLVPGDIVEKWQPYHLVVSSRDATGLQREEKMYYVPCVRCGRHVGRIKSEGIVDACERYNCAEFKRLQRESGFIGR